MNQHECIKCRGAYRSEDPDAYLCGTCFEAKKAIARDVDAQFASRPSVRVVSDLEAFEQSGQTRNIDGRTITFNRA